MQQKILNVLCIVFGIGMIVFGANKFFNFMPMPKDMPAEQMEAFAAFGKLKWLMPLIAIAEIVGGALMLLPKTRALGAIVILPVTVGIVLHNAVFEPSGLAIAGVFAAINIWAIIDNKKKYEPMIG
jgi:putative oxidoreductase